MFLEGRKGEWKMKTSIVPKKYNTLLPNEIRGI